MPKDGFKVMQRELSHCRLYNTQHDYTKAGLFLFFCFYVNLL